MAKALPPGDLKLELALFPKEPWARSLVDGLNRFALQTVQAINTQQTIYKVIAFKTGPDVAASFPIDIPVDTVPNEVRVAMVLTGQTSGPVTVLAQVLSGGRTLRIVYINGLSANDSYSIRLGID